MPRTTIRPPRYSGWAESLLVEVEEIEAQPLEEKRYRVFVNGKEIGQVFSRRYTRSHPVGRGNRLRQDGKFMAALGWIVVEDENRMGRAIKHDTRASAIRDLLRFKGLEG